jgi:hypothetical protein
MGHGVTVIDPDNPQRLGPPLRVDEQGNWSVDTRLRLRGGMPPKRIQAARLQRAQRIDELRAAYERFVSAQVAQQRTVDIAHSVMERASGDPRFTAAQQQSTRERFDKSCRNRPLTTCISWTPTKSARNWAFRCPPRPSPHSWKTWSTTRAST